MIKYEEDLPKDIGVYLWHILDWNYLLCGFIRVLAVNGKELERLQQLEKPPYIYYPHKDFSGPPVEIVYYLSHMAHDHLPPLNSKGKPCVDGYLPFDMRWLSYKDDICNIQAKNLSGLGVDKL